MAKRCGSSRQTPDTRVESPMMTYETDRFNDVDLSVGSYAYRGRSVGGEETCHQMPGLPGLVGKGICLDIGYAPLSATSVGTVFVTHGHDDHVGGLARHAIRRHGRSLDEPRYFVPSEYADDVRKMIDLRDQVSRGRTSYKLDAIREGDEITLNAEYRVRAFRAFHRIPCLGYAVWRQRKRLRPEWVGRAGADIAAAKRAGEDIEIRVDMPEVVYCGDTKIEVVEQYEFVRKARVLLLECTMLDDRVTVADTRRAGHVHLDEIIERADLFENEVLMLTHFSARYSASEAWKILDERLPDKLKARVVPLLPAPHAAVRDHLSWSKDYPARRSA